MSELTTTTATTATTATAATAADALLEIGQRLAPPVTAREVPVDQSPQPLAKAVWDAVRTRARRDLGVLGPFGSASWVLAGLAVPVRILKIHADGGNVEVEYAIEHVMSTTPAATKFTFKSGPMTAADADLMEALAPALAATGRQVDVPPSVREAWKSSDLIGGIVVCVRRAWREARVARVPRLDHIMLDNGGSLEAWVAATETADESLRKSMHIISTRLDAFKKRVAALVDDAADIEDLVRRHKRAALNAHRLA